MMRPQSAAMGSTYRSSQGGSSKDNFQSPQQSPVKRKIVENNIRGKRIEAVTAEHLRPGPPDYRSTYQQEIAAKNANARPMTASASQLKTTQNYQNNYPDQLSQSQMSSPQKQPVSSSSKQQQAFNMRPSSAGTQSQKGFGKTSDPRAQTRSKEDEETDRMQKTMSKCRFDNGHPLADTLNTIVDGNTEYFNHISGLCLCGKCKCGKHKCKHAQLKQKVKPTATSLYAKDYADPGCQARPKNETKDLQSTFKTNAPLDGTSNYKNDYKPWDEKPAELMKEGKSLHSVPFAGKSNYKTDYPNWGTNAANMQRPYIAKTVIPELPFHGDTTYAKDYPGNADECRNPQKPIKPANNKSPLSPGIPFLGETAHMKDFKPFKVGNGDLGRKMEEYQPTESLPNQYMSHYNQHFTKPPGEDCPAKIHLDKHRHLLTKKN